MKSINGADGVSLYYVIRGETPDPLSLSLMNPDERIIYQAALKGHEYRQDNKVMWRVLKNLLVDTVAWSWINVMDSNEDGCSAMMNLRTHYDGPGAVLTRIASANQVLKTIHYNQEWYFPFEKYVTKLKDFFEVLEENGEGKQNPRRSGSCWRTSRSQTMKSKRPKHL